MQAVGTDHEDPSPFSVMDKEMQVGDLIEIHSIPNDAFLRSMHSKDQIDEISYGIILDIKHAAFNDQHHMEFYIVMTPAGEISKQYSAYLAPIDSTTLPSKDL